MPDSNDTADADTTGSSANTLTQDNAAARPRPENRPLSQSVNSGKGSTEQHQPHSAKTNAAAGQTHASPKKRRKVNHGMLCLLCLSLVQ